MTRQKKKERLIKHRKQQILDSALSVFSLKGFHQATIDDIAEKAKVAVGTIYNYYKSKRDLLDSLISRYVMAEPLASLFKHSPESDDVAFFSSLIDNRLNVAFSDIGILPVLLGEVQRDPEFRQQYSQQVIWPTLKLLQEYLESRVASKVFRSLNVAVTARALAGVLIGLSLINNIEGEKGLLQNIPQQELVDEVVKLILQGVQKK